MQRRFLGPTAAAAVLAMTAVLAGCGASDGSGSGDVTLKLVAADYGTGANDSSQAYWDGVARDFESKNPGIKIDVDVYSWKDVDREVAELVAAGNAPDIAQIGAYADYAADDKLYRLDQTVSVATQANFLPLLADAGRYERVQYGMPFAASTRLLFFNEELFTDAGIQPPRTWAEIRGAAQKLKARGVKYPFALPFGSEEAQAEAMIWMLSGGGGYQDRATGAYAIDSPENVQTFKWLEDNLVRPKLTGPVAPAELDRADAFAAFARGEVGMLNGHPTLMHTAERAGVKVGKVPLPGTNGESRPSMGVTDWMMGFKQKGHGKEIGRFLDFAYNDANVLAFSDRYDILPVTATASQAMEADPEHKDLREFLTALPTSELYPFGETSWAKVSASVKKNIGQAVAPGGQASLPLTRIANEAREEQSAE
ncbi:extracellular solute-binding protein [Streptomyces sp. NPDC000410]|uniref:ABC transporter substrate-binding protein n=1 Tax=Streptomyces sp. NPDC000410 TaxID=3154254 RepID=UPI00332859DA